jgi:hypothetical protein
MADFKVSLASALEARLEADLEDNFPFQGWQTTSFKDLYSVVINPNDTKTMEIVVDRVCGEVLHHTLTAFGRMLDADVWSLFFNTVSSASTPTTALDRMLDAASTSTPIPSHAHLLSLAAGNGSRGRGPRRRDDRSMVAPRQGRARSKAGEPGTAPAPSPARRASRKAKADRETES